MVPAVIVAPAIVTLELLVALKVGVVAEQPAPLNAVTPLMVSPEPIASVSVNPMFACVGLPAPFAIVKVNVLAPPWLIVEGANALLKLAREYVNAADAALPVRAKGPGAVPAGCPVVLVNVPFVEADIETVA